jgi:hypothetical protein
MVTTFMLRSYPKYVHSDFFLPTYKLEYLIGISQHARFAVRSNKPYRVNSLHSPVLATVNAKYKLFGSPDKFSRTDVRSVLTYLLVGQS